VESIGAHERNEVTTTQGFPLVFTARPHEFHSLADGFFFTVDLAYLFQKILGTCLRDVEMNGRFVLASRVSAPQGRTGMGALWRLGVLGCITSKRMALISGSGETSIPNSREEWWLDDALVKNGVGHRRNFAAKRRTLIIRPLASSRSFRFYCRTLIKLRAQTANVERPPAT
jgi:hypothetical protein